MAEWGGSAERDYERFGRVTDEQWIKNMTTTGPKGWSYFVPAAPGAPWTACGPDGIACAEWSPDALLEEAFELHAIQERHDTVLEEAGKRIEKFAQDFDPESRLEADNALNLAAELFDLAQGLGPC
jgi:hypothetical protein